MNKLLGWYAGLQEREQRALIIGGVTVAVMILLFGLLLPLQGTLSSLNRKNAIKREDLAWMQLHQQEISTAVLPPDTGEAPMVLVERTAGEFGLQDSLGGTAPAGNGVRVHFDAAPFDAMVPWLAKLDENYGLAIESISFDRTARPGLVNASITFAPSRP
jgi:general secretion pathway protein M